MLQNIADFGLYSTNTADKQTFWASKRGVFGGVWGFSKTAKSQDNLQLVADKSMFVKSDRKKTFVKKKKHSGLNQKSHPKILFLADQLY